MESKDKNDERKRGDGTMASLAKPTTTAFVLDSEKASEFLKRDKKAINSVLERFMAHKPKDGIETPHKK